MSEGPWAWVGDAWRQYRTNETSAIRSLINYGHDAAQRTRSGLEEASATRDRVISTAESHMMMTLDNFWAQARRNTMDYPLSVAGSFTALFCAALGASNGSLLGRAPKRSAFVGLLTVISLRGPITEQHGDHMAATSSWMSELFR
jgi:hypothetical protein